MKSLSDIFDDVGDWFLRSCILIIPFGILILLYRLYYWLRYGDWLKTKVIDLLGDDFTYYIDYANSEWIGVQKMIYYFLHLDILYVCIFGSVILFLLFAIMAKLADVTYDNY